MALPIQTRVTAKSGLGLRVAVSIGALKASKQKKEDDEEDFKNSIKKKLPKNMN